MNNFKKAAYAGLASAFLFAAHYSFASNEPARDKDISELTLTEVREIADTDAFGLAGYGAGAASLVFLSLSLLGRKENDDLVKVSNDHTSSDMVSTNVEDTGWTVSQMGEGKMYSPKPSNANTDINNVSGGKYAAGSVINFDYKP